MLRYRLHALAALLALSPAPALAACAMSVSGAKCVSVPDRAFARVAFAVGSEFPVYDHSMLIDLARHRLPAVDGPWRYYRVDGVTYRVDSASHRVLEVMGQG